MKITTLMLGELASNCYIQEVGNKKCVIVDIGGDAPIVFRRLEMMQLEPLAILLTHGHYDHIAGVEQVREKYQIPVYVHSLDENMLTDSRANLGDWLSTQPFQPVQEWKTVEDGDTLQFGDNTFTVIHTPGHTPGSVCLQSGDVLYTGDTLFRMSRGRTDFPGGSDAQMLESFRKLKALEGDFRVLPGHNEESTLSFEKEHNPTMRGL